MLQGVLGIDEHNDHFGESKGANGVNYQGGRLMLGEKRVYLIWYGDWSGNNATSILPTLLGGLSGSSYYNINTTYYDGSNRKVPNSVSVSGQTTDAYSQGALNLSDAQIQTVVSSAIGSGRLPLDPAGVYFVRIRAGTSVRNLRIVLTP